jgi:hypothetical protein
MANTDLVKKKPVALETATYKRLSDLAAQLRIDNPGGGFVSMSTAVGVLLDAYIPYSELKKMQADDYEQEQLSLKSYAANAQKNDPQYLELENETE